MADNATPAPENGVTAFRFALPAVADAEIVSVVVAAAPVGVTVAGEKPHDVPDGCPEQAKETAALNPFCGVMVTVTMPLAPDAMVNADGETAMVKVGGKLMV
jgi:hypothetical protein